MIRSATDGAIATPAGTASRADLGSLARAGNFGRIAGRVRGSEPGPTLVCVATLHGNEPAGALALRRVFLELESRPAPVRGELLGLIANLGALAADRRFLRYDLNRGWRQERVDCLLAEAGTRPLVDEEVEQVELVGELRAAFERARGPVYLIDLHTTSGESPPFGTLGDTLRNRAFAREFPLPMVLGLEEQLEGALLEWVGDHGVVTLGFEGGRHDDPAAVDNLEAVVRIAAHLAGVLESEPDRLEAARALLLRASRSLPGFVEVRYRHGIPAGTTFVMNPGHVSFESVRRDAVLATQDGRQIAAPESGRILMPLYQAQGDDGFFIIRDVRPFWIKLSGVLRRLRACRAAARLPGVRPNPDGSDSVIVNRRRARWYAIEIFHLLGFRREEERGHELVMSRRHFDTPSGLQPGTNPT